MCALTRFPVIVGPTAGGKTSLAVALAHRLNQDGHGPAEVVSADSMQVFSGMDIGTAKPTPEERAGIPHHLIDVVEPTDPFSVDRWLELAEAALADIRHRSGCPIVVGGTHLYAKAFLEGLFQGPGADPHIRAELAALTPEARRAELEQVDPDAAARIHPNDDRRTIRALEVHRLTGIPISSHQRQWDAGRVREDALLIGLTWSTAAINARINTRVRAMVAQGLFEEVEGLRKAGRLGPQAAAALGYHQVLPALEGTTSRADATEQIKIETRRFAKNQRTWLRRLRTTPGSLWLEPEHTSLDEMVQVIVNKLVT
ncbi:MAG: tRNA (adenosine(37)-N6)-dimethylallyltransferase MiaA [Phycisphaerales bacterium]|nr:tRNA (adenosine(37)-N6)-dimethylallyltransferase MiaA [Phycisphaerales bacterium]